MKAKKKFGQNFLKDESVLNRIIQSMPHNNNALVEIGPGLGDLTSKLLEIKPLIAYEVDDDLSLLLKKTFSNELQSGRLTLEEVDVLEAWDANGSLHVKNYDLVANLPYYIATSIILRGLKDTRCKNIIVMVQKEVAEKFAAIPKQKEFSALSVLARSIANVKILLDVPPIAFEPPPKVTSSVISFCKTKEYEEIFTTKDRYREFEVFLKNAFKSPRKTLLKNMSALYSKEKLITLFESFDIPLHVRPHELKVAIYHHLFTKLNKENIDEQRGTKTGSTTP